MMRTLGRRLVLGLLTSSITAMVAAARASPATSSMFTNSRDTQPIANASKPAARGLSFRPQSDQLYFERNDGQHDPSVLYVGRGSAYSVILDGTGATLTFPSSDSEGNTPNARISFAGRSGPTSIKPLDRLTSVSNFIGSNAPITNVPNYDRIEYEAVYAGIDAVFHPSTSGELEIDFVVTPAVDPTVIGFEVDGLWRITAEGDVAVCKGDSEVTLRRPSAYQTIDEKRVAVDASYVRDETNAIRVRLGAYNRTLPLVIDPVVTYATAIKKFTTIGDIAVDNRENVYAVGSTNDSTFTTTPGAFQPTFQGGEDAVIVKYNKTGQRIFATFLGNQYTIDRATGIAVDSEEQMYVTGWTSVGYDTPSGLTLFPVTPGSYQSYPYKAWNDGPYVFSSADVFVAKFNSAGSGLLFCSLVAGSGNSRPGDIALGPLPDQRVYVTGFVNGPPNDPQYKDFPTTAGAYRSKIRGDPNPPSHFNDDGFVFALSNDGASLVASTLFGGLRTDSPNALAVDSNGDVWIAGDTDSFDFPKTPNAYRRTFIGPIESCGEGCTIRYDDAFLLKFNASMTQLLYGTFLPGNKSDVAIDVTTDPEKNVYVVGNTLSDDFPTTPGVFKTATHGAFIAKFNSAGAIQFSTVLGGATPSNAVTSIGGVRTSGDVVFVSGSTTATDFATKGPIQAQNAGSFDMFFAALNASGNLLEFSTYFGGTGSDGAGSLELDAASNLYVLGSSDSPTFPYGPNPAEQATVSNSLWMKMSADRDGDGLLDWWELSGIDSNGDGTIDLDLAALGANVNHKDLFVEIDFMTAAVHDHDPRTLPNGTPMATSGIAAVVTAFANSPVTNPDNQTGITLHVNLNESESIPEQTPITTQGPNSDFNRIKLGSPPSPCGTAHFGSVADRSSQNCQHIIKAKRRVYRYALFAHNFTERIGSSGIGELPGNDLVVSLRVQEPNITDFEDFATAAANQFGTSLEVEWRDLIAGTFMHEFGHTLGLHHGGGRGLLVPASREEHCKPNYLSVMNYARQFNRAAPAPGTSAPPVRTNRTLDYSRSVLGTLAESALAESSGIGGPAGVSILYGEGTAGTPRVAPANGAIDWNGQLGIEAAPVSADINQINLIGSCRAASPGGILFGHDDWSNIVYNFRLSPDYADGTSMPLDIPEPNEEDISGGLLGTPPPVVTLTAPAHEARFNLGVSISISATATDDGSIASVLFLDGESLLATDSSAPYSYNWTNAGQGTHIVRALATDNVGAATAKQVTVHVGCTASFTPTSASAAFDAASGVVDVAIPTGCTWTGTSNVEWLSVTPTIGSGAATLAYVMAENTATSSRTATITVAGQAFVVTQDGAPPFGAPTGLVATGTGSGTPMISVTWHGTSGAASYEVAFSTNGTTFTTADATQEHFLDITNGIAAGAAYLVKVRGTDSSGTASAYSTPDLASTFIYTDDPLQVGVTGAEAVHWTELQTAVNAVRQLGGLSPATWTANIAPGQIITTTGITELRTAMDQARTALTLPSLTYTDNPLTTGTQIRAVHITQLRSGTQ